MTRGCKDAGILAAGAAIGLSAFLNACAGETTTKPVTNTTMVTGTGPVSLPWPYEEVDPIVAAKIGYEGFMHQIVLTAPLGAL